MKIKAPLFVAKKNAVDVEPDVSREQRMNVKNKIEGLVFFALWFLVGGAVSAWTTDLFIIASIGGVFEPPAIWSLFRDLGLVALPFLLIFGGAPVAIQIMRGQPWQKIAVIAFAICATTWLVHMVVVIWGPPTWGWSW